MRTLNLLTAVALLIPIAMRGQNAAILGQVRVQDGGPLGYSAVAVVSPPIELLTRESGKFLFRGLPAGQVRIRIKHIGYAPKDTVVTVADNDTLKLDVSLSRLVIQLPAVVIGADKCTNTTPVEPKSSVLAELFGQVNQNAERLKLLASERPFLMDVYRIRGYRNASNKIVATRADTILRHALPAGPYHPKNVIQRGEGADADGWVLALPELPDFADTAFTNNHCFRYAGQTRLGSDSVIQVDYEPVPWLDKEVDIKGAMYLRVDGYQLIGTTTVLNRIPPQLRSAGLQDVTVRARFSEIVTGIPVLDDWEMTTKYRYPQVPRIELGQVFGVRWTDSTVAKVDTLVTRRLPRP